MTRREGEEACHRGTLTDARKKKEVKKRDALGNQMRKREQSSQAVVVLPGGAIFALASLPIFAPDTLNVYFRFVFDFNKFGQLIRFEMPTYDTPLMSCYQSKFYPPASAPAIFPASPS